MAKTKVKVIGAYVDGSAPGTVISVEEKSANHLVKIGYAEKVAEDPKPKSKAKSKPKQAPKKAADKADK